MDREDNAEQIMDSINPKRSNKKLVELTSNLNSPVAKATQNT